MNSENFFKQTPKIAAFESSFLNEKSPAMHKIFDEISEQIAIPSLNNKPNGLPSSNQAKKPSFCSGFKPRIDNLFGLFNYEFCCLILSKINIKKILYNHIQNQNFKDCMSAFNYCKLRFFNSEEFKRAFKETNFFKFHFQSDNIDIGAELLRQTIFDKIINDIAKSTMLDKEDVFQECGNVLKLVIDDSEIDRHISIIPSDFKLTPFFRIASNLRYNFESIKSRLCLHSLIDSELKPGMDTNFLYLIGLIKDIYPDVSIDYTPAILDVITNYFIALTMSIQQEINFIVGFEKSSRIQLIHILKAVASVPYSNLTQSQLETVHYVLLSKDDINKGFELAKSNSTTKDVEDEDD